MKKIVLFFLFLSFSLEAAPNKGFSPSISAHEYFDKGALLFAQEEWRKATPYFVAVVAHSAHSDFHTEALYYLALSYYNRKEFDLADRYFTHYLESSGALRHYEKALEYKFAIAENYAKEGYHRHLFGRRLLPPLLGTLNHAVRIYDEVIAALADNDLAVRALYGKAQVLCRQKHYHESVEAFKSLVYRYEVHPLAEMSFLHIGEIYLERSLREGQNPDLLALAELNVRTFRQHFPSSPQLEEVAKLYAAMEESFAKSLLDTARFYERKSKPKAAKIYLEELIAKYPNTEIAKEGRAKLEA